MDIFEQMQMRFSASKEPTPTEDITKDNEALTQWYLEHSFFKDFVYKNPEKKKGKEFSDALIIYDDTIIIIQNKTKLSERDEVVWARKNINIALKQLKGSYRSIKNKLVTAFYNEVLNIRLNIDLEKHKCFYGLIVLAQDSGDYNPYSLIKNKNKPDFPFTIISLNDLFKIIDKMDTAADLIVYFELRFDAMQLGFLPKVNNEQENMNRIADLVPLILESSMNGLTAKKRRETIETAVYKLTNRIKERSDYIYSVLIDDMIARAHDLDQEIYVKDEKNIRSSHKIAEAYGYLTRERRIEIGKRLLRKADKARKGFGEIFVHVQKPIQQTYIYFFTLKNRKERKKLLKAFSAAAQKKYSNEKVLAVATEPFGTGGRSYDFFYIDHYLLTEDVEIPEYIIDFLPNVNVSLI